MNIIRISGVNIEIIKKKPRSTLETVYGVGRVKANKINDILLTNPRYKKFKQDLVKLSQELKTQRIFKSIKADSNLKLAIYSNLERKARIGCYSAKRILQNLPSKGQRTHTNAGTPNRLNPFVVLGLKSALTQELMLSNKKWELNWNGRSTDLLEFSGMQAIKKKYSKSASQAKKTKKVEKKNRTNKK